MRLSNCSTAAYQNIPDSAARRIQSGVSHKEMCRGRFSSGTGAVRLPEGSTVAKARDRNSGHVSWVKSESDEHEHFIFFSYNIAVHLDFYTNFGYCNPLSKLS